MEWTKEETKVGRVEPITDLSSVLVTTERVLRVLAATSFGRGEAAHWVVDGEVSRGEGSGMREEGKRRGGEWTG